MNKDISGFLKDIMNIERHALKTHAAKLMSRQPQIVQRAQKLPGNMKWLIWLIGSLSPINIKTTAEDGEYVSEIYRFSKLIGEERTNIF